MNYIKDKNVTTEPAPEMTVKYGCIWAHYATPNDPQNYIKQIDLCDLGGDDIPVVYTSRGASSSIELPVDLEWLLTEIAAQRYNYVFVYDDLFFTFLDAYALNNGYQNYDEIKDDSGLRRKVPPRTYCERSGSGTAYTRKIWVRAAKAGSKDRHKRTHAITFINFAPVVGLPKFYDCAKSFGLWKHLQTFSRVETLRKIILTFNDYYTQTTGTAYLGKKPAGWTAGSLARNNYLKIKYPHAKGSSERLFLYQKSHPASEEAELHYRAGNLLLGGIIYMQRGINAAPLTGTIRKYDCNGLYSYIGAMVGEFTAYTQISTEEYIKAQNAPEWREGQYVAILKFTRLSMSVKEDMPPLFANPFDETEREDITINRPYYMFADLYEELQEYYDIFEAQIDRVILCYNEYDKAIDKYVNTFNLIKIEGKKTNNDALAFMGKFFNNNLMGKFSQHTATYASRLEVVDGVVERKYADEVQSVWSSQHFDYVRGAYIYVAARVYIMQMWRVLNQAAGWTAENLYYIDTDCFITRDIMPAAYLHAYRLGAFKVENEYILLRFITYKRYVGIDVKTGLSVKCAGIQNEVIYDYISAYVDTFQFTYAEIFRDIHTAEIKTPILRRTAAGGYYSYEPQKISAENAFAEEYKSI